MADDVQNDELEQELIPADDTPQMQYEDLGDGKYKWEDGVITDQEGNEIPETPPVEPPKPVAKVEEPKPAKVEVGGRQIYTLEGLEASIYTDQALNEIADVQLTDPLKAERMRASLARTYSQRERQLERYAGDLFEQELAELERDAPQAVQQYSRAISRQKAKMTPEQLQSPGMAKWALSQAHTEHLYGADALTLEEDVVRSRNLTPKTLEMPKPVPTPIRRVIPKEAREPSSGSGAPQHARVQRPAQAKSKDPLFDHYRTMYPKDLFPDVTDGECQAWADELRTQDQLRRRVNAA